jgi:hypothetical protein
MLASAKDHTAGVKLTFRLGCCRPDSSLRMFNGSPVAKEKTSNPILKGIYYDSNACTLQCPSELADLRQPRPLAGLPSSLLLSPFLEKGISVFSFGPWHFPGRKECNRLLSSHFTDQPPLRLDTVRDHFSVGERTSVLNPRFDTTPDRLGRKRFTFSQPQQR